MRLKRTFLITTILGGYTALYLPTIHAQSDAPVQAESTEAPDEELDTVSEISQLEEEESVQQRVIVTGSRIQRDTFSSLAPLQVIGGSFSREAGLLDPADILQSSTAASGQQIDETFSGFVLDNGPGATTVDLRGLGANRTLVLLNGRRISPAGVEGAPSSPDLGLLPRSLIDRYEILLDGASSIYGSDAVSGVTNAILRKDFDGLELETFVELPEHGKGEELTLSAAYGFNTDRGFFGFGAEYNRNERVKFADRPWTAGCDRHYEVTTEGEIRTLDIATPQDYLQNWGVSVPANECKTAAQTGLVTSVGNNNFTTYWTPGQSNTGIPNISDSIVASTPVDLDGDGVIDIDVLDYSTAEIDTQIGDLYPQFEKYSLMAYGEYVLPGEANITPYYEALYAVRKTDIQGGLTNLAPTVPADNPYNPCNPNGINGVDCGLANEELFLDPAYRETFATGNLATCEQFGYTLEQCTPELFGLLPVEAIGPDPVRPFLSLENDRSNTKVEVEQLRLVAGVRGDMPILDIGTLSDWTFDIWGSYSESEGTSKRPGVRYTDLLLSLNTSVVNADGSVTCGDETLANVDFNSDGVILASNNCVPVNLFTNEVLGQRSGQLTADEAAFLYDVRDFGTTYKQAILNGVMTGTVASLPAGPLQAVLGFEVRTDDINSDPDDIALGGVFRNFFSDPGTNATKDVNEYFGELSIPIVANQPFFREMNLELAGRVTDDELYGSNDTYNAKFGWRPHDSLLLRGTYGTSFRAPSLAENFLGAQTGFFNIGDPCVVPESAIEESLGDDPGTYNADLDPREPEVLANCTREGLDPTTLGLDADGDRITNGVYGVEATRGGSLTLAPETSTSYSYGFSFEQPWFDNFNLAVSLTYYNIEIEDSIIRPSGRFVLADCYLRDDGIRSQFCDRITRGNNTATSLNSENLITTIGTEFINRDEEKASGFDLNVAFDKDLTVFGEPIELRIDFRANKLEERSTLLVDDEGNADFQSFEGYWGFPKWRAINTVNFDYNKYRFTWRTDYLSAVEQDPDDVDDFGSFATGGIGDTCIGAENGGVDCRDFAEADAHFEHNVSLYYRGDSWTIGGGVRNVFDQQPPVVDSSEVTAYNNTPLGVGYDLQGRTFFMNIAKKF